MEELKSAILGMMAIFGLVTSKPNLELFLVLQSSFPVCWTTLDVFLSERNTGQAMKWPELQYRKKTSNWVTLQCHNSDPNERINLKKEVNPFIGAKLPFQHKKLEIKATFFQSFFRVFMGVFWTFRSIYHFSRKYCPPFPV